MERVGDDGPCASEEAQELGGADAVERVVAEAFVDISVFELCVGQCDDLQARLRRDVADCLSMLRIFSEQVDEDVGLCDR